MQGEGHETLLDLSHWVALDDGSRPHLDDRKRIEAGDYDCGRKALAAGLDMTFRPWSRHYGSLGKRLDTLGLCHRELALRATYHDHSNRYALSLMSRVGLQAFATFRSVFHPCAARHLHPTEV